MQESEIVTGERQKQCIDMKPVVECHQTFALLFRRLTTVPTSLRESYESGFERYVSIRTRGSAMCKPPADVYVSCIASAPLGVMWAREASFKWSGVL
jgi:hypothetical protein